MDRHRALPATRAQLPGAQNSLGKRQEVVKALDHAAEGTDVAALGFAIDQAARAGVCDDALARATKRKAALEEEAAAKSARIGMRDAEVALETASAMGNADMLLGALGQAAQAGISSEVLVRAGSRAGAAAKEARLLRARPDAVFAIRTARQKADMPALLMGMRNALSIGLDHEVVRSEALGVDVQGMAARILHFASGGTDLEVLDLALEWARQEDVAEVELKDARRRRSDLEEAMRRDQELAEAAAGLANALKSGDPVALAVAIDEATKAGVSGEMIRIAHLRRGALLKRAGRTAEAAVARAAAAAVVFS